MFRKSTKRFTQANWGSSSARALMQLYDEHIFRPAQIVSS